MRPGSALCIGINDYRGAPLTGCLNDTRAWAEMLTGKGYRVTPLLDRDATHRAIVESITQLIDGARSGESIVITYAGHGTQVPDLDGDEPSGQDQALVPVDFNGGAFLIDDDIRQLLSKIGDGVDLTLFLDCCHSGTATRFAVGSARAGTPPTIRYLPMTPGLAQKHQDFRRGYSEAPSRGILRSGGVDQMKHTVFAACLDGQTAKEEGGRGYFSLWMLEIVNALKSRSTNNDVADLVARRFSRQSGLDQTPRLDANHLRRAAIFLGGL